MGLFQKSDRGRAAHTNGNLKGGKISEYWHELGVAA